MTAKVKPWGDTGPGMALSPPQEVSRSSGCSLDCPLPALSTSQEQQRPLSTRRTWQEPSPCSWAPCRGLRPGGWICTCCSGASEGTGARQPLPKRGRAGIPSARAGGRPNPGARGAEPGSHLDLPLPRPPIARRKRGTAGPGQGAGALRDKPQGKSKRGEIPAQTENMVSQ